MTTQTGTSLAAVERDIAAVHEDINAEKERHKMALAGLESTRQRLVEQRNMAVRGVDPDTLALAKSVIYVEGSVREQAGGAFTAAIEAIAAGGDELLTKYIGAKRYDGFHQRCDCKYGYGPSHGYIVFEVGLTRDIREKAWPPDEHPLTEEQADAAIRWLHALRLEAGL
jgi:hypothetical protein